MFSENNKVSGRQLGRMIFVETSGTTAFLALNTVSKYGSDGILMMVWIYLFALVYAMASFKLARSMNRQESKKIYRIIRALVMMILVAKYLCMAALVLNGIADVARLILIPNVSSFFIIAATLASILYCINGGIEARGRASELLFYFVLIPIVIICVMLVPKVEPASILPTFNVDLKSAAIDFLFLVWFFVPAESLFLAKDCYDNTEKVRGKVYASISLSALVNIAIFTAAVGVYGAETVSKMERPVLRLMQISGIPGDFLNRQDGIMSVFLIVSMFCSAWALIYHINELIKNLFLQNKNLKMALKVTSVAVVLVVFALFMFEGKHKEKFIAADVGGVDLEERKFIMSIVITKADEGLSFNYEIAASSSGDGSGSGSGSGSSGSTGNVGSEFELINAINLSEAEEKLYFKNGTHIDYSHMKVLIMDLDVLEETEIVKEIVTEMSNNIEFAENIVVCAIDLKDKINQEMQYGKNIEVITKNQEMFKNSEVFRFDKMYSLEEGTLTIPLIDTDVNLIGSGIVTCEEVFWQYADEHK